MVVDLVEMLRTRHSLLNGQDLIILNANYLSVYKVYAMHNAQFFCGARVPFWFCDREASSSKLVQCIEVVDLLASCALSDVTIIR